jgi:hypothetical protein
MYFFSELEKEMEHGLFLQCTKIIVEIRKKKERLSCHLKV